MHDKARGQQTADQVGAGFVQLDVTQDASVAAAAAPSLNRTCSSTQGISRGRAYRLLERYGAVDLDGMRQGEQPAPVKSPASKA